MIKVLMVFGTRPEAIKMAPLIKKMESDKEIDLTVCVTGQHREQLDQVLRVFDIVPKIDFNIMKHGQTLADINAKVLICMQDVFTKEKYDICLVHGDPTSTLAGGLSAFYNGVPVGHVEAGLRSGNIYSPFPEELNRIVVDKISTLMFAATGENMQTLIDEKMNPENIIVTGNTVIDALFMVKNDNHKFSDEKLNLLDFTKKIVLLTAHRRENLGQSMESFLKAIKRVIVENSDTVLVWPVHLNPKVRDMAKKIFSDLGAEERRFVLIEPLEYVDMINLMAKSHIVLTDSGGIQEEAPALGIPVVLLRTETERQEAIDAGTVLLAGTEEENVYNIFNKLLSDSDFYSNVANSTNPYGDGRASERIVEAIKKWYKETHVK